MSPNVFHTMSSHHKVTTGAPDQPMSSPMSSPRSSRHTGRWFSRHIVWCSLLAVMFICYLTSLTVLTMFPDIQCDIYRWTRPWRTFLVPNIIHFIRFDQPEVSFMEMICIRAAWLHQRPEKIVIHSNLAPRGVWWREVTDNIPQDVLHVKHMDRPRQVFGHNLTLVYHASDVARLQVLLKEGGVYLDNDVYLARCVDDLRASYEVTVGWPEGRQIGNQVIIAAPGAEFLQLYYDSYRTYNGSLWYYNAGYVPTYHILTDRPHLVHRETQKIVVDTPSLYQVFHSRMSEWQQYYAFHLLYRFWTPWLDAVRRHDPHTIKHLDTTWGEMARLVYYGHTKKRT